MYIDCPFSQNLVVTSGATDGLQMILATMLSSGANVYTEDPTYFLAIKVLQQTGMNVIPGMETGTKCTVVYYSLYVEIKRFFYLCLDFAY